MCNSTSRIPTPFPDAAGTAHTYMHEGSTLIQNFLKIVKHVLEGFFCLFSYTFFFTFFNSLLSRIRLTMRRL